MRRFDLIRFDIAVLAVCFALYCLTKLQCISSVSTLVSSYASDYMAVPSLLALYNLLHQGTLRRPVFRDLPQIWLLTLVCSIVWELITPLLSTSSVGDPYDVLAYYLGATSYYKLRSYLTPPLDKRK